MKGHGRWMEEVTISGGVNDDAIGGSLVVVELVGKKWK